MAEDRFPNEGTHWLPDDASVVALVRQRDGGAWASGVAVGLADIVGRRRGRTFLANTVPGLDELDGLMESAGHAGLTQALAGELAVSEIARSAPQRSFAYLPAGSPALSLAQLREIPAFRDLLRRVAERGGTLLLYVAEEALGELAPDPDHDLPVDGCIAIGDIDDLALTIGAPLLARVERPSGDRMEVDPSLAAGSVEGDSDLDLAADSVEPELASDAAGRRVPPWAPWAGVAAGLLLAWFAWGSISDPAEGGAPGPSAVDREVLADPISAAGDGENPAADEVSAGDLPGAGGEPARPVAESADASSPEAPEFSGPELPYSVLVASFARLEDAERHLRELDADETMFVVAPTPIRERLYYRILAGAREDRADGEALMRELVESGVKEEVRGWDVRPVRHSWLLGTYVDRRDADRRIDELEEAGIRAYRLSDGSAEPRSWRVYAGAWESEEAADEFGRMLADLGESATLVIRRGRPR